MTDNDFMKVMPPPPRLEDVSETLMLAVAQVQEINVFHGYMAARITALEAQLAQARAQLAAVTAQRDGLKSFIDTELIMLQHIDLDWSQDYQALRKRVSQLQGKAIAVVALNGIQAAVAACQTDKEQEK